GAVFERVLARKLKPQRRGARVEADIRRDLLPLWHDRPISEIDHRDVRAAIETVLARSRSGSGAYANGVLAAARALFSFAVERDLLAANPCDRVRRQSVIGPRRHRERVLSDDELFALWRVTGRLRYPWGAMYQLLMLTGARLNEIAGLRWGEVDLERKLLTIPAERFKTGQRHDIPLSPDAATRLRSLPRFRRGDAVFSFDYGASPVAGFSKIKAGIDHRLLRTLRALARARGDEPASGR